MPFIVIDVGNSRMKWGLANELAILDAAVLALDDTQAWEEQRRAWSSHLLDRCVVTGSNPKVIAAVVGWLRKGSHPVRDLLSYRAIPLRLAVDHPETVGLDRLFNALAVAEHLQRTQPAIVVDAGSAVTVDVVEPGGVFGGGAIFPGWRLMARALHDHVPHLPIVEVQQANPPMPGRATVPALEAGIHGAVAGGIQYLVNQLRQGRPEARCFITGGDAALLAPTLGSDCTVWPWLTLEGIRLAALRLR
jgi:type III pantothenate kinase